MRMLTQSRNLRSLQSIVAFSQLGSFNSGKGLKPTNAKLWKFILPRKRLSALTTLTISNKSGKDGM